MMNPCSATRSLNTLLSFAASAGTLLALAGCSSGTAPVTASPAAPTQTTNAGNFSTTVFLGDSLTAGYQNNSLLDTDEVHGWAPLVATQAGFSIIQPLIAYPGAPATLLLQSLDPLNVTTAAGTTTGRDNPSIQVTDLAVPGAFVNDVANTIPGTATDTYKEQITQLVLGFPGLSQGQAYSQATFAVNAKPTTIFLWIGNNDELIAEATGMPSTMTSVADFTTQYSALITELTTKTSAHLVIANLPDLSIAPYLTPATTVLADYAASTGSSTASLSALLGIVPGDNLTLEGLDEVAAIVAGTQTTKVSDAGVLTAAELLAEQAQVVAYNKVIAAQAQTAGATLVDMNSIIAKFAAQGVTINGYTASTAYLGGFFSLDTIHPTNTGYAIIANAFIDAMNVAFKTSIPDVNLATVAAADPLWPPNLAAKPATRTTLTALSKTAAKSLNQIMLPDRLRQQ